MTARRFVALWGALASLVSAPGAALAGGKPNPLAGRDWGAVTGYVLDRESGQPVAGARVTLASEGAFAESGRTVGATDKGGRYRVSALIGRKASRLDLMSVVEAFPIGLFAPWGLLKQTRIVDARQFLARVEAPGHKAYVGVVLAQVRSAGRYTVHLVDVLLAPDASARASAAPADRPREQLLSYSIEPRIAAPGEKVTLTATYRLPQDGVRYTAGWYTGDKLFTFEDLYMKAAGPPDPETGARTFRAVVKVPKRPVGEWASMRVWLDRETKWNEVVFPNAKEVLVQVARTPEQRRAAEVAAEAYLLEQGDKPLEAMERYRAATAITPDRPSLWARIGYLSLRLNRPADAVAAYEKLRAADPVHPEATAAQYASALLAMGDTARALETLTAVERKADKRKRLPREFLLAFARTYLEQDDLAKADTYYGRAVKIGRVPHDLAQQFHLERARAAVKAAPESPDAHVGLARALFDLKRHEEAGAAYRDALRRDGSNAWAHLDLAACLSALDRDRDALAHYRQAATLAPDNLEARLSLAECSRKLGDFPAALAAYRKVAAAPARRYDFRVQHGLGLMLLAAGDEAAAVEALGQAVHLAREKGNIGGTRIGTGMGILSLTPKRVTVNGFDYPEAEMDYALIGALAELHRLPGSTFARYQAGAALIELGLAEKGLVLVKEAAAAGFEPADARYLKATAQLRLGRRDDARRGFEAVLKADPGHKGTLLALARLAFDAGDTAGGQAYLLRVR